MKPVRLAIAIFLASSAVGLACNIPVFRYALERWQSDTLELLVFHEGPLSESQEEILQQLRRQTKNENGNANLGIQLIDLQSELSEQRRNLWKRLSEKMKNHQADGIDAADAGESKAEQAASGAKLPFAALRGRHLRGSFIAWRGLLADAPQQLLQSPARRQLSERILNGHSIVWLVIRGDDPDENAALRSLLTDQLRELSSSLELPEGIGLPGSELFSQVPLFLKFSVLEIDREDAQEGFLLGLAEAFHPQAFQNGEPLVMPVFGRGRALEVIPAAQLNGPLIRDLTAFLSAACSCQVKEQNPGFDLLMNVAWQTELFGEDGAIPPASTADGLGQQKTPVLLSIPPGRK